MSDVERHDVVIVGAGLAGLRLATSLVGAGRDVVVVEARDRVGGRVFSHRFANGQWCERGAEFVDESHGRVLALVRSLDLTLLDRGSVDDPNGELLDVGGRPSPLAAHPDALAALAEFHAAIDALPSPWTADDPQLRDPAERARLEPRGDQLRARSGERVRSQSEGDQSRARSADWARLESQGDEFRARSADWARLESQGDEFRARSGEWARSESEGDQFRARSGERGAAASVWTADASLADLPAAHPVGRYASTYVGRAIRTEWMLPPGELGQAALASRRPHLGRERYRVAGGNDQLATGLAAPLGSIVRLETPVQEVDDDAGAVRLADGRVLRADAVVVTVPLPVLGRIWPDVPSALTAVGYGIGGKVSVQFGRRLWRDYGRNGSVHSDRAWGEMWETTDVQPGDAGVLTVLLSSHDGAALMAFTDLRRRLLAEIERIFPGARGLAGEVVVTDWTNDPWSLGAYSAPGPGQLAAAWSLMHRPHGRLWLAGEHTDEHAGFMEGALASADRVATALLS